MRTLRLVLCVLSLILFSVNFAKAEEDKLVAIVNNEVITEHDKKEYLNILFLQLSDQIDGEQLKSEMKKAEDEAVTRLIEDKLIVQEAKNKGLNIDDREIEQRYKAIKNNFQSETEFDLYLKMHNLTPADIKNKIKDQLLMRTIIETEVKDKVFVHPQEVTEYYNTHKVELKEPERIELDSILVKNAGNEWDTEAKMQEILKKLRAGQDFSKLRQEYSDSQPIGTVKKGTLNEEIEKVVFNLKPQEVSKPVKTNNGIYLFKLINKIPESEQGLEETREQIYQMLFEKKFTEKLASWLDGLKEKAYILVK